MLNKKLGAIISRGILYNKTRYLLISLIYITHLEQNI